MMLLFIPSFMLLLFQYSSSLCNQRVILVLYLYYIYQDEICVLLLLIVYIGVK